MKIVSKHVAHPRIQMHVMNVIKIVVYRGIIKAIYPITTREERGEGALRLLSQLDNLMVINGNDHKNV